jgi:hypothetical protein
MRVGPIYCAVAFLLAVALLAGDGQSQTTTSGGLSGVVIDQTNAVVPDAAVEIKDVAKGTTQSAKTDGEGVYQFSFLRPTAYRLSVTHPGFREERRAVTVQVGSSVTVNVTLQVASTGSEIVVSGEAPLIHGDNADVSVTMNQKQISEVPNPGNDLTYIVQTSPGVVMNTDSQTTGGIQNGVPNFSILGMPGSSYHYTLDGMSITDSGQNLVIGGSLGLSLGQNQIQETTVVSTGYNGQFGGAAGGNINYTTKSGSNEFHGNAQYYWNGRALNANDWFNKASGNQRPFSIANQWASSFGGPIKKDKVFLFVDSEGLRLLIPEIFLVMIPSPQFENATLANIATNPSLTSASYSFYKQIFDVYNATPGAKTAAAGGFPPGDSGCAGFADPNNQLGPGHGSVPCAMHFIRTRSRPSQDALTSGRLDWNLGTNDRAFFRLQGERGRGSSSDAINSAFDTDYNVSLWQAQALETHTFGPNVASQLVIAGFAHSFFWGLSHPSQASATFPRFVSFDATNGAFTNLGGANWIGSYGCHCNQYELSEDVIAAKHGHKFGFGANLARGYWGVPPNTVNAVGQLRPQTLDAFFQGGIDLASPAVDYTSLTQSFTSQTHLPISFWSSGIYGQDEWHVRSNLTLSLGVRVEHYSNPVCQTSCFSRPAGPFESMTHDPNQPYSRAILTNQKHALNGLDNLLWSPRFSFAWQPFGVSHNSVLRGGIGVFYDPLRDGIAEAFYINAPNYNVYRANLGTLAPGETNSLFERTDDSNTAFLYGFKNNETLAEIQAADPTFSPPVLTAAPQMMHLPQYQRWSLEWQQAIATKTTASVGYYGHHGIHELNVDPSANAYCDPKAQGTSCPGFISSLPMTVPDTRFSQVTQYHTAAFSNYNGLVASIRHQFSRFGDGVVQLNYTYGHALDEVSNGGFFVFTAGSSLNPQDPSNLRGAYGPAEYDVRHSLNGNYVWELPLKAASGGHGSDYLVKGWQVSGTIFWRTGFPYTAFDIAESFQLQQNNYFGSIYSVATGPIDKRGSCGRDAAVTSPVHLCQPAQFFVQPDGTLVPNPSARFVQSGCETGFNSGHLGAPGVCDGLLVSFAQHRNSFRGPGYFNADFAIMKNTKIPRWEKASLGIGLQFFNMLNHPNFGLPNNWSSDAYFGSIGYLQQPPSGILGSGLGGDAAPRMIQIKAQLRF